MKRILIAAVLVGALVQAGTASAGCMATVGLAPPPKGIAAGTTWTAEVTVLQHGQNAAPERRHGPPDLTIVNTETGERKTFVARPTGDPARLRRPGRLPGGRKLALRGFRRLHERRDATRRPARRRTPSRQSPSAGPPAAVRRRPPPPASRAAPAASRSGRGRRAGRPGSARRSRWRSGAAVRGEVATAARPGRGASAPLRRAAASPRARRRRPRSVDSTSRAKRGGATPEATARAVC